jgi:hypothetical protein
LPDALSVSRRFVHWPEPERTAQAAAAAWRPLTRAEIAQAVPQGSRRARGQHEALRDGLACPELAGVRADFREHLTAWWRLHVTHASWGGPGKDPAATTRPTRARVCQLGGMSESTYKACRRWWEARGRVAIVRPGCTPDLRPMALSGADDRNDAQVYVLCVPRRACPARPPASSPALTRPLAESCQDSARFPAREAAQQGSDNPGKTGAPRSPVLARGMLAEVTDGWWAHLTAPFAAWSAFDVVHAVDHAPDGRQHRQRLANVRHPAGWLRWRLSLWLNPDGTARPSPGQLAREAAERRRAESAARRAGDTAAALAATPDSGGRAAEARRMLADASPSARAVIDRARARRDTEAALRPEPVAASNTAPVLWHRDSRRRRAAPDVPAPEPTAPQLSAWWADAVAAAARAAEHEEGEGQPPGP